MFLFDHGSWGFSTDWTLNFLPVQRTGRRYTFTSRSSDWNMPFTLTRLLIFLTSQICGTQWWSSAKETWASVSRLEELFHMYLLTLHLVIGHNVMIGAFHDRDDGRRLLRERARLRRASARLRLLKSTKSKGVVPFAGLPCLPDRKGGWQNGRLSGWPGFVLPIRSAPLLSGSSLLVHAGSQIVVAAHVRPEWELLRGEAPLSLENPRAEFVWAEGQMWRSPPLLGTTTQELRRKLKTLCGNLLHQNWHSPLEPRCTLTNKYFSPPRFRDDTGHPVQIKRQNVSLISAAMSDR